MDDFEFTYTMIERFLRQKRIQTTLDTMMDYEIEGWEKWWQVELAMYIDEYDGVTEWDWEIDFGIDQRTKGKNTSKIAIDLAFRRKNYAKDKFIYLELKTAVDSATCIRNMVKDFGKVNRGKKKSKKGDEIREVFLVGIHSQDKDKSAVREMIHDQLDRIDFWIESDEIRVTAVRGTDYFCTIF